MDRAERGVLELARGADAEDVWLEACRLSREGVSDHVAWMAARQVARVITGDKR